MPRRSAKPVAIIASPRSGKELKSLGLTFLSLKFLMVRDQPVHANPLPANKQLSDLIRLLSP